VRARRVALSLAATLALILLGSLTASGHPGHGKHVIQVRPGQGAITRALAKADAGDKLRIHSGRYRESPIVTKPVTIVGTGKGRRPVIDGRCKTSVTVAVSAPGVVLDHLKVIGATDLTGAGREVDFTGVATGTMEDLRLRDTCDAEYGINLFQTGPVSVTGSRAAGFSDAGIYVGDVADTLGGTLVVRGNESFANNKGIIVEFSSGGDILVEANDVHDNTLPAVGEQVGIFIHRSDGVRMVGNSVTGNGAIGVQLTPDADGNMLDGNTITGNPADVRDEGTGNCGTANTFVTGDPLPPC
jgi:parallel beta-helix repeat protein